MSFDASAKSLDRGEPVELYLFRWGTEEGAYLAVTNASQPIPNTEQGPSGSPVQVVYQPQPITRAAYKVSGKVERSKMDIRVAVDSEISRLFLEYPPSSIVTVIVRQLHLNDPEREALAVWNGRVLTSGRAGRETVLSCDNTTISLKRVGLRRKYQYGCPLVLYGQKCKASKADATYTATVAALSRDSMTLVPGWNGDLDPADFSGGIFEWQSEIGQEIRPIRRVTSSGALQFVGSLRGLEVGSTVKVILGCNHQMSDCRRLHNNILNYGGQAWIPTKNPIRHHPFW